MTNAPDWLSQVQQLTTEGVDGKSETGAALSALADAMTSVKAGDVIGAAIDRGSRGTEFAVLVSDGEVSADVARLAEHYDVPAEAVTLMAAADLIEQQYNGVATCSTIF